MSYDDETLMAFADGELDPALRAAIAAAIDQDLELARRVAKHRALRAEVAGAFAPVLNQPVPENLQAAARTAPATPEKRGNIVQFPMRGARVPSPGWHSREWGAMAASLLLGLVISWRIFAPADPALMSAHGGALVARGELAAALEQQLASNQGHEQAVQIGLTFKTAAGPYCRSFTLRSSGTVGLACRQNAEWQIPVTTSTQLAGGEMTQAGSALPAVIRESIEARIAGAPLDSKGEESARLAGWDPSR